MESNTRIITLDLANGGTVKVEATMIGDQKISVLQSRPFKEATQVIEAIANELADTFQKLKPKKASVKFGLELAIESGKLTTLIVKGSSKANLEVTLEWEH